VPIKLDHRFDLGAVESGRGRLSDGGGKRPAALAPILGRDRIARFFAGVVRKLRDSGYILTPTLARINGQPGVVFRDADGIVQTMALEVRDGAVVAVDIVRNPDKLGHLDA